MLRLFLYRFHANVAALFRKRNLLLQVVAGLLTYVFVVSGFDWWYFESTRGSYILTAAMSAALVGAFVPVALALGLYVVGKVKKNEHLTYTGAAVAQAGIMGLLLSSFYKAFTGRIQPPLHATTPPVDISHSFNFGFLKHGVFWGWPSSHTTVAFATAIALATMYPKNTTLRYAALAYAFYIGLGVSVSIHWFSDFVAGAILGTIIGVTVGRSFLRAVSG